MLKKLPYLLLMLLAICLESCQPTASSEKVVDTPIIIREESTPSSISTPIPVTITLSNTQTPSAELIVPEETLTPPLTSVTPMPTLSYEEKSDILTELMMTNGGCLLPCWWGIVPGQSDIKSVGNKFYSKGFSIWDEGTTLVGGVVYTVDVKFEVQNNNIHYIQVKGGNISDFPTSDWEQYYLHSVLNQYGKPSQIQIFAPWRPDPGPLSYDLFVFYPDLGIVIEYVGLAEELTLETGRACPQLTPFSINLTLYQPEAFSVEEILQIVMPSQELQAIAPPDVLYDWTNIEMATEFTLEHFYRTFKEADKQQCFDFVSYWQQ